MEARALHHERLLAQAHGDEALQHAIAAADLYMQAARKASTPAERSRLNRKCSDLIVLAERLKANAKAAAAGSRPLVPESTRPLTTAEKTIVLRASRLHGNIFPPWESAPGPSVFSGPAPGPDGSEGLFTDPAPFSLSAEQQTIFAGWQRPSEMLSAGDDSEATAVEATEIDLAQDLATDCSVVASLCAAVRHLGPSKSSLLSSLMYPFDHEAMTPAVSKNGKYIFRMYFNGSWRQVVIDDRLPASSTDRTLFVVDRRHPRLLWPALIEKAYLKIRGGYDFPGSNSGTDLHAITGWIPEQIFLQSEDIELDETWDRIKKAFDQGSAIVTLGTGNISPEEEEALGLVKEHDYAVLDLKTDGHNRLFLIKNPWCDSLVWTGVGSSASLRVNTAGSPYENMTNMFWMTFEDVLQHFDSLYVNWNPALFTHRQDHHFTWTPPDDTEELVFTHNPQYTITSPTSDPVWILLSRHHQDAELDILRQRRRNPTASLSAVSSQLGFTSLSLHTTTPPGTRVPLHERHRCLHQLPYVDSPNTLLRYTPPSPSTPLTLVISQSSLPLPKYTFTLTILSTPPLTVTPSPSPLPFSKTLHSSWTRRTAGGSTTHPSYLLNPQFTLVLPSPSPLTLLLSTPSPDLPIHVAILFSSPTGGRITALTRRALLGASPEYSRGRAFASVPLADAGTYTIVTSTFEPGQTARFALRVSTACEAAELRPVPADAAGRLRTAARRPAPAGAERVRARLEVGRLARVSLVVRSDGTGSPAVRGALEVGTGPDRRVVAVTGEGEGGEFADAARGLRTDEVDVDPEDVRVRGGLWAVVEQLGSLTTPREGVSAEVLSDGVVTWGEWEVAEES